MSQQFSFLKNKKIFVTGGNGFLGSHVMNYLNEVLGMESEIFTVHSKQCDLRDSAQINDYFNEKKPDVVISIAARLGGIGDNVTNPADYFYDNIMIGMNVINSSYKFNVKRLVTIGTVCSYPKITPTPFKEEDLWNGYPEETNAAYGVAKKAVAVYAQAMEIQHKFPSCHLLLTNLYGPGDDFRDKTSHVIPSLIKKIESAKKSGDRKIIAWGDGSPSRDFLYVKDAAKCIVLAAEKCTYSQPINLGSGEEVTIRQLFKDLINLSRHDIDVEWDITKPNGQPRRLLDITKAKLLFNFSPETKFKDGLENTYKWYKENQII